MRTFFADHGLLALFVLMVADNVGVPLPSEIPLLFAGFFVSTGQMAFVPAILVAATGSLVGALVLYVLGRTLGRAIVHRWGRLIRVTDEDLDRAESWFHRRGELSVLYLRMVPLARTLISIPAGMLEMHPVRFGGYTFGGALAWTIALVSIGWAMGGAWENVLGGFGLASAGAAAMIAMVVGILVVKRIVMKARAPEEPPPPAA